MPLYEGMFSRMSPKCDVRMEELPNDHAHGHVLPMPIPMPISMTMAMPMLCPCPCPNARVRSHGSNLGRLLAKKPQQIVCQLLILTVEKVFFRKTF